MYAHFEFTWVLYRCVYVRARRLAGTYLQRFRFLMGLHGNARGPCPPVVSLRITSTSTALDPRYILPIGWVSGGGTFTAWRGT